MSSSSTENGDAIVAAVAAWSVPLFRRWIAEMVTACISETTSVQSTTIDQGSVEHLTGHALLTKRWQEAVSGLMSAGKNTTKSKFPKLGTKSGRLTVIDTWDDEGVLKVVCRCSCGCACFVTVKNFTRKDARQVKSCGCLKEEADRYPEKNMENDDD